MIVGHFLQEIPASSHVPCERKARAQTSAGTTGRDEFDGRRGLRVSARRLIQRETLSPLRYKVSFARSREAREREARERV